MTQNATSQTNTGPRCAHCGEPIAPQNDKTAKLFAGRDWSGAKLLCSDCHAGQRELYKNSRRDYYDRREAK